MKSFFSRFSYRVCILTKKYLELWKNLFSREKLTIFLNLSKFSTLSFIGDFFLGDGLRLLAKVFKELEVDFVGLDLAMELDFGVELTAEEKLVEEITLKFNQSLKNFN